MHFADMWDIKADVLTRVVKVTKQVAEKMATTLNTEGINTFSASGKPAGQERARYALTGSTGSAVWLVKTDLAGNAQWNKTYGDAVVGDDFAYSLVETGDGGYALAGYTRSYGTGTPAASNSWLVKTDGVGNMEWSRACGGVWNDEAYSVVETSDGGYALAGYTYFYATDAPNSNDFSLIKITGEMNVGHRRNFSGVNLIVGWSRTYEGASEDAVNSLIRTSDGGYALAGYTNSSGAGGYDFWLVRTDAFGVTQWSRTYGGTSDDYAFSLVQTSDGGYAIAGQTNSYGAGGGDFWLVKSDVESGLAQTGLTDNSITLYRGSTDLYWNYVRVRMWLIQEPSWICGDINMDGVVDNKDLYIIGRNYGKTFSLLSLTGIIAVAGIHTVKKRRQNKQPSYIS